MFSFSPRSLFLSVPVAMSQGIKSRRPRDLFMIHLWGGTGAGSSTHRAGYFPSSLAFLYANRRLNTEKCLMAFIEMT